MISHGFVRQSKRALTRIKIRSFLAREEDARNTSWHQAWKHCSSFVSKTKRGPFIHKHNRDSLILQFLKFPQVKNPSRKNNNKLSNPLSSSFFAVMCLKTHLMVIISNSLIKLTLNIFSRMKPFFLLPLVAVMLITHRESMITSSPPLEYSNHPSVPFQGCLLCSPHVPPSSSSLLFLF